MGENTLSPELLLLMSSQGLENVDQLLEYIVELEKQILETRRMLHIFQRKYSRVVKGLNALLDDA